MQRRTRTTALAALATCVLAVLAWRLGAFDALRDPARAHALLGTGLGAEAAFALVVTGLSIVGVPPIVFLVPATLIFPRPVVFALGMIIGEVGGVLGFYLARTIGRRYVETRIPARMRAWNERIAKHGLLAVILLRLAFFVVPPASWVLGLSKVRSSHVVIGTAIGIVPWAWACAYVGGSFLAWLGEKPPWVWAIVGAIVLGAIAAIRGRDEE